MTPARKSCRVSVRAASLKIFTDVGMLGNDERKNGGEGLQGRVTPSRAKFTLCLPVV